MISWQATKEEQETIHQIARRASETYGFDLMTTSMDVTAVHANGCPLDLDGLAEAEPFDFAHDVSGIVRHIDRDTGKLTDCFLPRYSI